MDTVKLNGRRDLAFDGEIRPYIGSNVRIVKVTKAGLYQIQTWDGKLFSVPKYNLELEALALNEHVIDA